MADESHKNKHHLDGLIGAMQSLVRCHLLACIMQLFMILRVFAVKEDCCSEKEEGSSGKESCQKKGPPQVLSVAWLASTQFFVVDKG